MIFLTVVFVNILLGGGVSTCLLNQIFLRKTVNQTVSGELVLLQWNYVQFFELEKNLLANEYENVSIQTIDQISNVNNETKLIYFIFGHDIPESKLLKNKINKLNGSLNIILYGNEKHQLNDYVVRKLESLAEMNENHKIFTSICVDNQWKMIDVNNLKYIKSEKKNIVENFQMLQFISLNSPLFACSKNKEGLSQRFECNIMDFISDNLKIPFAYKVFKPSQHDDLLQIMNELR